MMNEDRIPGINVTGVRGSPTESRGRDSDRLHRSPPPHVYRPETVYLRLGHQPLSQARASRKNKRLLQRKRILSLEPIWFGPRPLHELLQRVRGLL